MSNKATRALVVGGGITGTMTALVLARDGIETELVERDRDWRALGHGITMIGPALRALDRVGLLDACLAEGWGVTELGIHDVSGKLHQTIPLPQLLGPERPGLLGMMRPTLQRILATAAIEAGVTVRKGTRPESIIESGHDVEVGLSDGSSERYDFVIGADGLHSWVRDQLFGEVRPEFQRQGAFRAVLPRPSDLTGLRQFHGHPHVHPGFTPTGADTMYMFCVRSAPEPILPDQQDLARLMREALADFGGSAAEAREQITDPDKVDYRLFETLLLPPPWNRSRVLLLGDAVHTTTPHLAAGAAMCLEDAIVLGEEIGATDAIPEALDRVSARRYDRCRYAVDSSVKISHWQTHPDESDGNPMGLAIEASQVLAGAF